MQLPDSFIDLAAARLSQPYTFVNIIGVVVDMMAPKQTATGEYMMTFKLLDPALRDSAYGNQGLTVRFFKGDPSRLPKIAGNGDVVLLRAGKMMLFNGQLLAMSHSSTTVLVFPGATIPSTGFETAYLDKKRIQCLGSPFDVEKLKINEQAYVIRLKEKMSDHVSSLPNNSTVFGDIQPSGPPLGAPTGPASMRMPENATTGTTRGVHQFAERPIGNEKFKLIKDCRHRVFADIIGQVVKKFTINFGASDLYVTDYTENQDMFYYTPPDEENERERDGDQFGYAGPSKRAWPGPYGWLVLKVNVKDPHAHWTNHNVEEGDFVQLRNVKMKIMAEGAKLEGDMWPDDRDRERVLISKVSPSLPKVQELSERKAKYWASRTVRAQGAEKPQATSKSERKKKSKEKKRKEAEQAELTRAAKAEQMESKISKAALNKNIRCSHQDTPISSLSDVLDRSNKRHTDPETKRILPFVNAKYRVRARVVDFWPKELEDFAILEQYADDLSDDAMNVDTPHRYEWSFSLQLEDATKPKGTDETDRIWVNLHHEEAQHLFGNSMDDPSNLREDRRLLAQLKEKLFFLWGELEEKAGHADEASNVPFECCILEYGVEMDEDDPARASEPFGFLRQYAMFGVTIL